MAGYHKPILVLDSPVVLTLPADACFPCYENELWILFLGLERISSGELAQ